MKILFPFKKAGKRDRKLRELETLQAEINLNATLPGHMKPNKELPSAIKQSDQSSQIKEVLFICKMEYVYIFHVLGILKHTTETSLHVFLFLLSLLCSYCI